MDSYYSNARYYLFIDLFCFISFELQPFIDEGHVLRTYFPDEYYAQSAPILFAYTIFAATFAYVGIILVRTASPRGRTEIKMKQA